ncbi:MAG: hypothetical protein QXK47_02335 [Candidatus Bathyarchaeia archaeon]
MSGVIPGGAIAASAGGLDFKALAEQYGKLTVREIVSGTSGLALAQLVAARAAIQLATLVDARQFCRVEMVPPGGGKTYHFQVVKVPDSFEAVYGETGSDISATDANLSDVTATLQIIAVRTDISDLAQRQAAVNLAEAVGIAHGNALNRGLNGDIYSCLSGSTTNVISKGTANNSANYTWTDIMALKGAIEAQRGKADTFVSYPYQAAQGSGNPTGFYPFIVDNITSVQFTTALASYVQTGAISELFGMKLYIDKVYEPANAAASGARLASLCYGGEAVGFALAEDIVSEVQRWAPQVGFRIVTRVMGKAATVVEPWTALIKHT